MKVKIHSSELNRMLKILSQCIDSKSDKLSNIEVIHYDNLLTMRGTNGSISAMMSTPYLGGEGESFCVDGTMMARVISMCNGEVEISTDEKFCTIKGSGRTRLPIVDVDIPAYKPVEGKEFSIGAEAFSRGYNGISYAISADQSRVVLTGVLAESESGKMNMVSLDGFRMATEQMACQGEDIKAIIPGAFMKLISGGTVAGEMINFVTNGTRIQARTDGMTLACSLLAGEYPNYRTIIPSEFMTECLLNAEAFRNALKSNSVVCNNNLVKLEIGSDMIVVKGNSEQADYTAEIACTTQGQGLTIAFNQKYMVDTIASIGAEEIVMMFNTPFTPCVVSGKDDDGKRLILPVRVQG